jgi:hypothetical protein
MDWGKQIHYPVKWYSTLLKLDQNLEDKKLFDFDFRVLFKVLTKFGTEFSHFEWTVMNVMSCHMSIITRRVVWTESGF